MTSHISPEMVPQDPAKALEYKEKGNRCFQAGDWVGAEALYSKAINHDPLNPLLYTNRSMALLKLSLYTRVITDSQHAISLSSPNTAPKPSLYPSPNSSIMKAYFQLAQAQIALHDPVDALKSAKKAHELCVDECAVGGKGASSIGPITELVLRCKREAWERKEAERLRSRPGLLVDVLNVMEKQRDAEISNVTQAGNGEEGRDGKRARLRGEWETKMEDVRKVFEKAGEDKEKRREVPDWAVDDITFAVMLDPVVTKTGQSYDRSSILEHLKRSPTDPLTREPLTIADLRPNLALRKACEEFLEENGWAVDW